MFKYFVRKLIMKVLCALIPSKKGRLALREKFGFGEIFIPLSKSDSFVPLEVLAQISKKSPLDFFRIHSNVANIPPPSLYKSIAKRFANLSVTSPRKTRP